MTSFPRFTVLLALAFALACGAAASPETVATPISVNPVPSAAALESLNQVDKKGQSAPESPSGVKSDNKEQVPQSSVSSASSNSPGDPATSPPHTLLEKKDGVSLRDTGATGIAPISNEQAEAELRRAGISPGDWDTDFTLRSVDYDDILGGGPGKDGIPAIDAPTFETVTEAGQWLDGREPVQVVHIKGDARAYPMQVMMWHEIVNDTVGGEPVVITY